MILHGRYCVHSVSKLFLKSVASPPCTEPLYTKPGSKWLKFLLSRRIAVTSFVTCFVTYSVSIYLLVNSHAYGSDDSEILSATPQGLQVSSPAFSTEQKRNNTSYSKELARLNRELKAKMAFAAVRPDSWLHLSGVAEAYFERARLSGNFRDYSVALNTLQKVFALVDNGNGPVLLRARLNYSLHRLPAIESDLLTAESALLINKSAIAQIDGIRADVMLQQGQYKEARQIYDELEKSYPSSTSAIRTAQAYVYTGDYEEAERWFALAGDRAPRRSAQLRSWIELQTGILYLEQGRLNEALVHYQHALELFPGYWLVEEHIAEIDALQGRTDKAKLAYRNLINRTGSPLFMIALAEILLQGGELAKKESVTLLEKADHIYATMASQIPEAIAGHALEHFLQRGIAKQALQLATDNYLLRSGGPSAVLFAQAHTVNGQLSEASAILDKLLTTQYRSADLHVTASIVYRALGFNDRADHQQQLARAINPDAVAGGDWLLRKLKAVGTLH